MPLFQVRQSERTGRIVDYSEARDWISRRHGDLLGGMKKTRIFDARGAGEIELSGVREALEEAGIEYYETSAGIWGLGNAAFWVRQPEDFERARAVVEAFQQEWTQRAHSESERPAIRWSLVPGLVLAIALLAWMSWQLGRW